MMTKASVEHLVTAAQRGDRDAFSALVDRHYALVHGLALSRVGNWSAAGDVTQEVFLTAWTHLRCLKRPAVFTVWLRRIARNISTDWARNEFCRRKLAASLAESARAASDSASDPAATAAREECLDHIGESLQGISAKLREAVVLYYLEGHSVAEGAHALGITEETMRKRLQLGCEQLRESFARQREYTLQQLLPYAAQPHRARIMAGLAVGPAMTRSGKSASGSNVVLGVHHLVCGGSWSALQEAGLAGPVLKVLGAGLAALLAVCVGGAALLADLSSSPARHTVQSGLAGDRSHGIAGMLMFDYFGNRELGDCVLIPWVFKGLPAYEAGLRPGDRVVRMNGRPVHPGYRTDPILWPQRSEGARVRLTVLRPHVGGAEKELEFDVAWGGKSEP